MNKKNEDRINDQRENNKAMKNKKKKEANSLMTGTTCLQVDANDKAAAALRDIIVKSSMPDGMKDKYQEELDELSPQPRPLNEAEQEQFFRSKMNKAKKTANTNLLEDVNPLGRGLITEYRPVYYTTKFKLEQNNTEDIECIAKNSSRSYVEGLAWVLQYYTQGVIDWSWYYPFHYAPFMVDIVKYGVSTNAKAPQVTLVNDIYEPTLIVPRMLAGETKPFKPLEQLLAVLPPESGHALPEKYRELMTDPSSLICDIYPSKFHEDPNGARMSYQFVCLLPFVDASRLRESAGKLESSLTQEEKQRNTEGEEYVYIRKDNVVMEGLGGSYNFNSKSGRSFHTIQDFYSLTGEVNMDKRFSEDNISWATINKGDGSMQCKSPLGVDAYKAYGCFPWPHSVQSPKTIPYIWKMPRRAFHNCGLHPKALLPDPVLLPGDEVQGEFDDNGRRTNRFNLRTATRIIAASLGLSGKMKSAEVQEYTDQNRRNPTTTKHGNVRHQESSNMCIGEAPPSKYSRYT